LNFSALIDYLKRYDYSFLGLNLVIFLFGIINLYSATHASGKEALFEIYKVQLTYFIISIFIGIAVSTIHPKNYYRIAYFAYVLCIFLLAMVLIIGHTGMGATRWLSIGPIRFQPSELSKICVVLALGRWLTKHNPEKELGLKDLIFPGLLVMVPAVLVVVQPDLGTGILILLIFGMMVLYRQLKFKTMLIIALISVVCGTLMYNYGLKEYQRNRIRTFINPDADAKGTGYNAIQSKIAIGSGQFFGKGFKKSSQASFNYLPENHTDFVFSVFNEEHGFFGSLILIILYVTMLLRYVWLSQSVTRLFESILAIGLMSIFFWHTFINMSMVTGLAPIVGIPLPMMSYGGSSLLTYGIAAGMATSLSNSRNFF
jgi:rod shape determining protein RodA